MTVTYNLSAPPTKLIMQVWLGKTLQKLDSLLLGVCQEFKEEGYLTVSILFFCCEVNYYFPASSASM